MHKKGDQIDAIVKMLSEKLNQMIGFTTELQSDVIKTCKEINYKLDQHSEQHSTQVNRFELFEKRVDDD